jgi:hypothetical protein
MLKRAHAPRSLLVRCVTGHHGGPLRGRWLYHLVHSCRWWRRLRRRSGRNVPAADPAVAVRAGPASGSHARVARPAAVACHTASRRRGHAARCAERRHALPAALRVARRTQPMRARQVRRRRRVRMGLHSRRRLQVRPIGFESNNLRHQLGRSTPARVGRVGTFRCHVSVLRRAAPFPSPLNPGPPACADQRCSRARARL